MKLQFLGVRGSTPVCGPAYARVGGHTSCLAVSVGDELPALVLDAGTGLQELTRVYGSMPFDGVILLTHLHWDHVQGLPFFPPADHDDARVTLAQPAQGDPIATLGRSMSPPHFPIGPDGLRGSWAHVALQAGTHEFGKFTVTAHDVVHKGGRAFGYRVECDGASFAYVPDAIDDNDDAIAALATGVDCFVRGAPFVSSEQARADDFGHGTVEHAVALAARIDVHRLVITHHSPFRTDDGVADIAAHFGVETAAESLVVDL